MWQEWKVPVLRLLLPVAVAFAVLIGAVWLLSLDAADPLYAAEPEISPELCREEMQVQQHRLDALQREVARGGTGAEVTVWWRQLEDIEMAFREARRRCLYGQAAALL